MSGKFLSIASLILAALAVWYARKNAVAAAAVKNSSGMLADDAAQLPANQISSNFGSTRNSTNGIPDHANYTNPMAFSRSLAGGASYAGRPMPTNRIAPVGGPMVTRSIANQRMVTTAFRRALPQPYYRVQTSMIQ